MTPQTEQLTAELRDELASNESRLVDPRFVPARFHHLKAMSLSPAHALSAFQGYDRTSLAIRLGAGVHAMLLGKPYAVFSGKVRRGKEWDAFKSEHDGKVIMNRKEYARATEVCASIRRHAIASNLLFGPGCIHEATIEWEMAGRTRRSTPDVRGPYHVAELKTARITAPEKFVRDGSRAAYHAQLADQCMAIQHATGKRPDEVYIVSVETQRPYPVTVFQLTRASIAKGERLVTAWLARLIECERTNHWPAYSDRIEMFDAPDDAFDASFVEETDISEEGDAA